MRLRLVDSKPHPVLIMAGKSLEFIGKDDVEEYLNHNELIVSLEKGFVNFSAHNGVVQPVRTAVEVNEHKGYASITYCI